jgi:hypothetical protein
LKSISRLAAFPRVERRVDPLERLWEFFRKFLQLGRLSLDRYETAFLWSKWART